MVLLVLLPLAVSPRPAGAVVLYSTGDPNANTATPGDNSGWQFQGKFNNFLGTPIAPRYFLTANHLSIGVGAQFIFHGEAFTTTATYTDPAGTDLRIYQVDHDFSTWTPLYTGSGEAGQEVRVFGWGARRGAAIERDGATVGWMPGSGEAYQRWGRNVVTGFEENDSLLYANFEAPGVASEAHFTSGDSGGGTFIFDGGLWKLAGINYAVDDVYTAPNAAAQLVAPIFDARGYYARIAQPDVPASFVLITGANPVPTSFYSTRVSPRLAWIQGVTGQDPAVLPVETFGRWLHAYFDLDQFADAAKVGPSADPDGDGLANLQEFAFNLDPSYAETPVLTAGSGVRGLPLVRLEAVAATGDTRLTVEYLRRTVAGGGGLNYAVQFADDLAAAAGSANGWQTSSSPGTVTALNTRWERVKVADSVPAAGGARRFARVVLTQVDE